MQHIALPTCKGEHTLFTGQRERERGRERKRKRERERETDRERERKREGEREREGVREKERVFIFKGMTGALAPFSYLVSIYCHYCC